MNELYLLVVVPALIALWVRFEDRLSYHPHIQHFNQKGKPLSNGRIWVYRRGSPVPKEIFMDCDGKTHVYYLPKDNFKTVVFDSEGRVMFSRSMNYE